MTLPQFSTVRLEEYQVINKTNIIMNITLNDQHRKSKYKDGYLLFDMHHFYNSSQNLHLFDRFCKA